MQSDKYARPVLVRDGATVVLKRVPFAEKLFNEDWLQNLLFSHPDILPFSDLEPAFEGSIPIARELPTAAGPIDLLYMNSKGYITLVETKLWRNPDARRSVIAQLIDYVKEMTAWSYDSLVSAIKSTGHHKNNGDQLVELFADPDDGEVDDVEFVDRVSRNLESGRFLLLVVGDGIQEGVEKMAEFLQQTPHLRYSLALVELAVYRDSSEKNEKTYYIQPKILARTKEVTRAVVELKIPVSRSDIAVSLPTEPSGPGSTRRRITEEEFFEELEKSSEQKGKETVQFAKWILDESYRRRFEIDWGDAGPIIKYVSPESGNFFTLGQLHKKGLLASTSRLYERFRRLGWSPEPVNDYLDDLASLMQGAATKYFESISGRKKYRLVHGKNPSPTSYPPFILLEPRKAEWFASIDKLVNRIN
ncbi:MAG: hypothetical protein P8175_12975 [Deltaproteobacteria bacterium]